MSLSRRPSLSSRGGCRGRRSRDQKGVWPDTFQRVILRLRGPEPVPYGTVRMHVILATVGTDGDVFPHLGLGATLHALGHRVTLAAPETYRLRAQALGIEFC